MGCSPSRPWQDRRSNVPLVQRLTAEFAEMIARVNLQSRDWDASRVSNGETRMSSECVLIRDWVLREWMPKGCVVLAQISRSCVRRAYLPCKSRMRRSLAGTPMNPLRHPPQWLWKPYPSSRHLLVWVKKKTPSSPFWRNFPSTHKHLWPHRRLGLADGKRSGVDPREGYWGGGRDRGNSRRGKRSLGRWSWTLRWPLRIWRNKLSRPCSNSLPGLGGSWIRGTWSCWTVDHVDRIMPVLQLVVTAEWICHVLQGRNGISHLHHGQESRGLCWRSEGASSSVM